MLGSQVVPLPGENELNIPSTKLWGNLLMLFPGNFPCWVLYLKLWFSQFFKSYFCFSSGGHCFSFFPLVVTAFHFHFQYTPFGSLYISYFVPLCAFEWVISFASSLFWRTPTYASRFTNESLPKSLPFAWQSYTLPPLPSHSIPSQPSNTSYILFERMFCLFHLCYPSGNRGIYYLVQSR